MECKNTAALTLALAVVARCCCIIIFEHRYDVDGSGSLDVEEVTALLHDRGFRMSSAELSGVFEAIDDDGNGVLDLSELRKMWTFLGAWREERREESGKSLRKDVTCLRERQRENQEEKKLRANRYWFHINMRHH